jgi:hypothetical protein
MSLQDNHLDDLFRERLGNFTPKPPAGVWNRIQEELDRKKRVRKMVFYRWAGAAAVLFLALLAGVLIPTDRGKSPDQADRGKITLPAQPVPEPASNTESNIQTANAGQVPADIPSRITSGFPEKQEVIQPTREISRKIWLPVLSEVARQNKQYNLILQEPYEIALMVIPEKNLVIALSIPPESHHFQDKSLKEVIKKDRKPSEWELGFRVSPAYASQSTGYSAAYAQNLSSSGDNGQTSMGGGLSVGLKTSGRWKVGSGLYFCRSELGKERNSLFASADANYYDMASGGNTKYYAMASGGNNYSSNKITLNNGKMTVSTVAGLIPINQVPEQAKLVADMESAIGMNTVLLTPGDFSQVFDYLELPLTASYQILEGKMELELQTGVSANVVVGNQVFIGSGTDRQYFGKTSNISRMGFSGIAGLGITYPLSKKLAINIEPRASYWLSSLNNSGEVTFKPWKIGVYSGLTFGF